MRVENLKITPGTMYLSHMCESEIEKREVEHMPGDFMSPLLWHRTGSEPDASSFEAWSAFTGQNVAAFRNWGWLNAIHPDDRDNTCNAWRNANQRQHSHKHLCRLRDLTGEYHAFNTLIVPQFDANHQLQNWLVLPANSAQSAPVLDENLESWLMYRMVFEQAEVGVLCISLDGFVLRVNECFCICSGYSENELAEMTLWQLGTPADVTVQLQAISTSLFEGKNYPAFRTRYLRKNGTLMWVRVTQFLIHQLTGEPHYFFCLIEDATAQVQAEIERKALLTSVQEAHAESLARTRQLEGIFEAISDGVLVCDSNGRIIESNSAVNRILHLKPSDGFLDMSFEERFEFLKAFDKEGQRLQPEKWPLARLLRGENLNSETAEQRMILPDGTEIYVDHSGSTMRDQNNQIIGGVLVIHDITERRHMEQHLRKSFSILLALAEELVHLPEPREEKVSTEAQSPSLPFELMGEYLVELTCQMLEYKSASITFIDSETEELKPIASAGLTPEVKLRNYEKTRLAHLSDFITPLAIASLRANEVVLCELQPRGGIETKYPLLAAPMMIDNHLLGVLTAQKEGDPPRYTEEEISLIKAIAKLIVLVIERERLQKEWLEAHSSELALMEANRRFDGFLSIASHELRTPLAGIKGNIQLALRRLSVLKSPEVGDLQTLLDKLEKVREYLLHAEHRVNVQNRMISDLLDVSRIQANKLELVMAPCDLSKIVREAVDDQRYNVPERLIALSLPVCSKLVVIGDADRLGQVIHNYLTNALKYSPPDRPIWVSVEETDNLVRVSVRDEGPGLSLNEQKHVWERFYRVKNVYAQGCSTPGLGLGLHICRTIIDAHQGKLGLESSLGEGSTFWFALPLAENLILDSGLNQFSCPLYNRAANI